MSLVYSAPKQLRSSSSFFCGRQNWKRTSAEPSSCPTWWPEESRDWADWPETTECICHNKAAISHMYPVIQHIYHTNCFKQTHPTRPTPFHSTLLPVQTYCFSLQNNVQPPTIPFHHWSLHVDLWTQPRFKRTNKSIMIHVINSTKQGVLDVWSMFICMQSLRHCERRCSAHISQQGMSQVQEIWTQDILRGIRKLPKWTIMC